MIRSGLCLLILILGAWLGILGLRTICAFRLEWLSVRVEEKDAQVTAWNTGGADAVPPVRLPVSPATREMESAWIVHLPSWFEEAASGLNDEAWSWNQSVSAGRGVRNCFRMRPTDHLLGLIGGLASFGGMVIGRRAAPRLIADRTATGRVRRFVQHVDVSKVWWTAAWLALLGLTWGYLGISRQSGYPIAQPSAVWFFAACFGLGAAPNLVRGSIASMRVRWGRGPRPSQCVHCGYPSGTLSSPCPECGGLYTTKAQWNAARRRLVRRVTWTVAITALAALGTMWLVYGSAFRYRIEYARRWVLLEPLNYNPEYGFLKF